VVTFISSAIGYIPSTKTPNLELFIEKTSSTGADPEGGAPGARPPKIGKNMIFWRKIVIFHTKYPKVHPPNLKSWIRP
jgi:hypothetical protein